MDSPEAPLSSCGIGTSESRQRSSMECSGKGSGEHEPEGQECEVGRDIGIATPGIPMGRPVQSRTQSTTVPGRM
eukprot:7933397-Pyramimonas_sp.AAC.1